MSPFQTQLTEVLQFTSQPYLMIARPPPNNKKNQLSLKMLSLLFTQYHIHYLNDSLYQRIRSSKGFL